MRRVSSLYIVIFLGAGGCLDVPTAPVGEESAPQTVTATATPHFLRADRNAPRSPIR